MENNGFFGTVLRSMGYDVTSVGARVCEGIGGGDGSLFGSWFVLFSFHLIAARICDWPCIEMADGVVLGQVAYGQHHQCRRHKIHGRCWLRR